MNQSVGKVFPDLELPDHTHRRVRLSEIAAHFPLILVFYRGYWRAKCQVQLRLLTECQEELAVNDCKLAVISVDPPEANAAFRAGLGSSFPFLSDAEHKAINALDIVDTSDQLHGTLAIPCAFSLLLDLTVHKIYCGWWYVRRPTVEELRQDLREMMKPCRPDCDSQSA